MGYFVKATGDITYNAGSGTMEYSNGAATVSIAKSGAVAPVTDTIVISNTTYDVSNFVTDHTYIIATLGATDFTTVGATSVTTTNFVSGVEYIITTVGDTDFTLIGATANIIGEIFTATGVGGGTTGVALETLFVATGGGIGGGTALDLTYTISVDYGSTGDYDFDPDNPDYITVFIESVYQEPTTAYTMLDDTITFTSVPPNGLTVTVIHGAYSTFVPSANIF